MNTSYNQLTQIGHQIFISFFFFFGQQSISHFPILIQRRQLPIPPNDRNILGRITGR